MDAIVCHPHDRFDRNLIERSLAEALAASPPGYDHARRGSVLLPRRPLSGRCRVCGETTKLTREHIPPKASGNQRRSREATLREWLRREDHGPQVRGKVRQGGISGYTLCQRCNSLTGARYGREYCGWSVRALKILRNLPPLHELDRSPSRAAVDVRFGGRVDGGVAPGAFVRQVLSCMCSVSGEWDIARMHPAVRRIILGGSTEPLPPGLRLGMGLFVGPATRVCGPQVRVANDSGAWEWVMELAHPPFAFIMVLAANHPEPEIGVDIGAFTLELPTRRAAYSTTFAVGFGHTPYPGDYRSAAAVECGR